MWATNEPVLIVDGSTGTDTVERSSEPSERAAHSAPVSGTAVAKPHFEVVASSLPASPRAIAVDDTSLYLQAGSGSTSQIVTLNLATKGVSQLVAPTGTGNLQPFRHGLTLGPVSPV